MCTKFSLLFNNIELSNTCQPLIKLSVSNASLNSSICFLMKEGSSISAVHCVGFSNEALEKSIFNLAFVGAIIVFPGI